jgi:hypothetical protein
MRRLFVLACLCVGCASGFSWKENLRQPDFPKTDFGEACGAEKLEACFDRALGLVQSEATRPDGVRRLSELCGDGFDRACDVLQAHAKPPEPVDDFSSPGYPRAALEKKESGLLLIKCLVPENGILRDCVAVYGLKSAAPAMLRWFAGKRMRPLLFDGQPVESEYVIPIQLMPPCGEAGRKC